MFYTIYKITNLINGTVYHGAHRALNPNDSYMGSGKAIRNAITKYGIENFTKEVLFIFDNPKEMYEKEKEIVWIGEGSYNLVPGGHNGMNDPSFVNRCHQKEFMDSLTKRREAKRQSDPVFAERMKAGGRKGGPIAASRKPPGHMKMMATLAEVARKNNWEQYQQNLRATLKKIDHQKGNKNSQFGSKWIADGLNSIKIKSNDDIPTGWSYGRK